MWLGDCNSFFLLLLLLVFVLSILPENVNTRVETGMRMYDLLRPYRDMCTVNVAFPVFILCLYTMSHIQCLLTKYHRPPAASLGSHIQSIHHLHCIIFADRDSWCLVCLQDAFCARCRYHMCRTVFRNTVSDSHGVLASHE